MGRPWANLGLGELFDRSPFSFYGTGCLQLITDMKSTISIDESNFPRFQADVGVTTCKDGKSNLNAGLWR